MKRLGVLTSGGDAPGMSAAIRAVTREALARGISVTGFSQGYAGVLEWKTIELTARAVGGIIQHGGTMLGSARSQEFCTEAGLERAIKNLHAHQIEGLVVIGGNGSQSGAADLSEKGYPVVGVASTIDNDLYGTELCIGVDTALNTAMEAVDRLRVTASSHRKAFHTARKAIWVEGGFHCADLSRTQRNRRPARRRRNGCTLFGKQHSAKSSHHHCMGAT
jgi:6-phosphofructokinase 1